MADGDKKRLRDIKIKTGVVKRLGKEKNYYEKESVREQNKLEKMKAEGTADEYEIRKQDEVLGESKMMIPDCIKKLGIAWDDLNGLMTTESDLSEAEEYKLAQEALAEWKEQAKRD